MLNLCAAKIHRRANKTTHKLELIRHLMLLLCTTVTPLGTIMRACARTDRETTKSLFFRNGQESRCVELHLVYTIDYGPLREIEYFTIEKGIYITFFNPSDRN